LPSIWGSQAAASAPGHFYGTTTSWLSPSPPSSSSSAHTWSCNLLQLALLFLADGTGVRVDWLIDWSMDGLAHFWKSKCGQSIKSYGYNLLLLLLLFTNNNQSPIEPTLLLLSNHIYCTSKQAPRVLQASNFKAHLLVLLFVCLFVVLATGCGFKSH